MSACQKRFVSVLLVSGVVVMLFGIPAAQAESTWYVDDDAPGDPGPGDPSVSDPLEDGSAEHPFDAIQEGIDAAVDGDEVLVADGRYTGEGNRDIDFAGRAITVRSLNGPETCIIDCQGTWADRHRGFSFHGGETTASVLDGFTITNGKALVGGGISCDDASPTISDCTIARNMSLAYGGGVYCDSYGSPTIRGCRIIGNWSDQEPGGALYCESYSTPTLIDCAIVGNHNDNDGGGAGIVGWLRSHITIINCTITGHTPAWPQVTSGVACESATIVSSVVVGNSGGIAFTSGSVVDCVVSGNSPGTGIKGGPDGGIATITDCTIVGHDQDGVRGQAEIANCVLRDNTPEQVSSESSVVTYSNVEGGWPGVGNLDADPLFAGAASGNWTAQGVYDPDSYQITCTDTTAAWAENELIGQFVTTVAPDTRQFVVVGNTATTVTVWADFETIDRGSCRVFPGRRYEIHDYRLLAGSPCIDAGDNDAVPVDEFDLDGDGDTEEPLPFDLDGNPRIVDDPGMPDDGHPLGGGPLVDMGAYEFQGETCFGDLDGDGEIGLGDLAVLLGNYETTDTVYTDGDLDRDEDVDLADLAALLGVYGTTCP